MTDDVPSLTAIVDRLVGDDWLFPLTSYGPDNVTPNDLTGYAITGQLYVRGGIAIALTVAPVVGIETNYAIGAFKLVVPKAFTANILPDPLGDVSYPTRLQIVFTDPNGLSVTRGVYLINVEDPRRLQ